MQGAPPDELILQTHSTLILEDAGVITSLAAAMELRVHISIETDNEKLSGLPRHACSVEDRIEAVRMLSDTGVFVVVCMAPLLPMAHPESFFEKLAMAGAKAVVIDHFIEGDGTANGSRTLKTPLPEKMKALMPASVHLDYRDEIASIAGGFLPTGVSSAGFSGIYSTG
jgi:DNA repair photolyase